MQWRSKWLMVPAAILLAIILFLVWAIRPVDYTPYFFTDYYQQTREQLQTALEQTVLQRGELQAGMARVNITPAIGASQDDAESGQFQAVPLAGYGDRQGAPAKGVHDSLFIKAVALRVNGARAVMITWDGLIFPKEVAEAVAAQAASELGIGRDRILFSATHSHCGIGAWGEGYLAEQFAGKYNPAVRQWMIRQSMQAIRHAVADLTPARLGHGAFRAPQFVRNRLVKQLGWVDDEFTVCVIRQDDGDYAVLGAFAAHATVLSGEVMLMSGDYPGYWQRAVERQIPGEALFFAGGVGSHGPRGSGTGFERAQNIGEALADSVLQLFPNLRLKRTVALAATGFRVQLPSHHVRISDGLRVNPVLARKLLPFDTTYVNIMRLDSLLWVGTPCDFSGEMAIDLKNLARRSGFSAVITSFNGGYVGYLIPGKYYHYDSYESRIMSFFGPYMGPYFDELIRRMMAGMMAKTGLQTHATAVR